MTQTQSRHARLRLAVLGGLLTALSSQINISLLTSDFNISVAIVLLPVFAFLIPGFPVLRSTLFAAPGVFLLRAVVGCYTSGTFSGTWAAYAPEMLFYLSYGLLLSLYLRWIPLHPFRVIKFLPLVAVDALANLCELLVRLGLGALDFRVLLRLVLVGIGRSFMAVLVIRTLDFYGFQVLRREDAERYQRLLLLTSTLKSEIAWMDKGTALIERTMNAAYQLYSQLRRTGADPQSTDSALTIAKDIHEVKKEYFLIMRGISDALDTDALQSGMWFRDLLEVMRSCLLHTAEAQGKLVSFNCGCTEDFYTTQHHYLMSILHNLLGNAVEAAPVGVPVHISLLQRDEKEVRIFEVRDDCGGVKPDLLPQIFVAGFSSKINHDTGEINRGLGLSIVKDLVEQKLYGSIAVTPAEHGTVFTIRVPKIRLEGSADAVLSH